MSFKIFTTSLVLLLCVSTLYTPKETIDTPEFVEKFKVEVIKRGSYSVYPKEGDNVLFHYVGKNMQG